MRVAIVNPPQTYPREFYDPDYLRNYIPIGVLQVCSVLEAAGHDVKFIDAFTLTKDILHETEDQIHYGATWDAIEEALREFNPDVACFANLFSSQSKNPMNGALLMRKINPEVKIVVGGPHATVRPKEFLEAHHIDYAIMGEGEYSLRELLECIAADKEPVDVAGVAYMKGDDVVINEKREKIQDLDALPYPAYHLCDLERYFELYASGHKPRPHIKPNRIMSLVTSRGCPYSCSFCSIHLHMGKAFRVQSPEYVLGHLRLLKEKYNVQHLCFEDDNLTLDKPRFETILDGMISENFNFTWDTPNGVRADKMDENLLIKSKQSGCTRLVIGVESGNQAVLDKYVKKALDLDEVRACARLCQKYGIDLHAFFIIGFPQETKAQIQDTLDFAYGLARDFDVVPAFTTANPLIDTPLYKEAEEQGLFAKEVNEKNILLGSLIQGGGMITTEEFTPGYLQEQLQGLYKRLTFLQFRKPKYLVSRFVKDPKTFLLKGSRLLNYAFSKTIKQ